MPPGRNASILSSDSANAGALIGNEGEIATAQHADVVIQLQVLGGNCRGELGHYFGSYVILIVVRLPGGLEQRHAREQARQRIQQRDVVRRPLIERMRIFKQRADVLAGKQPHQLHHLLAIHRTEHGARIHLAHFAFATECQQLVEQRQRIAQRTIRRGGDQTQRRRLGSDPFLLEDVGESRGDGGNRQPLQVELQATRQHRHRQFLRIGGGQQELHMRWWLFQRLQQRIERMRRQHVHFVDQVDLVAAAARQVLHVVEQVARVVDLGA